MSIFQKSDIGAQAAWKGFSSQILYTASEYFEQKSTTKRSIYHETPHNLPHDHLPRRQSHRPIPIPPRIPPRYHRILPPEPRNPRRSICLWPHHHGKELYRRLVPRFEKPFANEQVNREDYIANQNASRYAVAFDRKGRLGWKTAAIEDEDPGYGGAHIIEVMCEDLVSDAYLAYLKNIGVSYIFAGKSEMDLELALEKLQSHFSLNVLLLEGGSEINGAFEAAGLIDELSLVQSPVVADAESKPLFENSVMQDYIFKEVTMLSENVVWLRAVKRTGETMRKIKLSCVIDALEMASDFGTYFYDFEKQEEVYLREDSWDWDEEDKELAELIEVEDDRFIRLPGQYEIDEYSMMEDFIGELEDERMRQELYQAIRGRGAFRRFKDKIRYENIDHMWYEFQDKVYREFAIKWCEEKGLLIIG